MALKISHFFWVLLVSALPVVELRGAIPLALGLGFSPLAACLICVFGSMLPVPLILLFIRPTLHWLGRFRWLRGPVSWLEARAWKKSARLDRYSFWGLLLFVVTPLPGTGAWMGSLVGALLGMRFKLAFTAIFIGVLISGIGMTLIATGLFAGVEWLKLWF